MRAIEAVVSLQKLYSITFQFQYQWLQLLPAPVPVIVNISYSEMLEFALNALLCFAWRMHELFSN